MSIFAVPSITKMKSDNQNAYISRYMKCRFLIYNENREDIENSILNIDYIQDYLQR